MWLSLSIFTIARLEENKWMFPPQYSSCHDIVSVTKETYTNIIYDFAV
jgi:hypothetical protein